MKRGGRTNSRQVSRNPGLLVYDPRNENCTKNGRQTLIDKLESGVPRTAEYTRELSRVINLSMTPDWHRKVWRDGGHYMRRGDLREVSEGRLPVILHQMHRHDKRAGDKIELVATGERSLLEMLEIQSRLYKVDALESRVMRLDLAADLEGPTVSWFRDNTEIRGKQIHEEWGYRNIEKRTAETLYSGRKPKQLRVYDKTKERMDTLKSENRKAKGDPELCALSFQERWGYDPAIVVTRVERQIGGSDVKRFGYTKVGNLWQLAKADPFTQIVFPSDLDTTKRGRRCLEDLPALDRIAAMWMRDLVLKDGIVLAKNELRRQCGSKTRFYVIWDRIKEFAMPREHGEVTRNDLLESFRESINAQLQRAA